VLAVTIEMSLQPVAVSFFRNDSNEKNVSLRCCGRSAAVFSSFSQMGTVQSESRTTRSEKHLAFERSSRIIVFGSYDLQCLRY
jgi:hypothetical protein